MFRGGCKKSCPVGAWAAVSSGNTWSDGHQQRWFRMPCRLGFAPILWLYRVRRIARCGSAILAQVGSEQMPRERGRWFAGLVADSR